jgi:DNA-binding YbaB/EbfC family protein
MPREVFGLKAPSACAALLGFGFRHTQPSNPPSTMAGVGKLLKQAQKMQRSIETLQTQLASRELDFSRGGGAVQVKINGAGQFVSLKIDAEFLKEDAATVSSEILAVVQEASAAAKKFNEEEMQKVTSAFQMPGLF